MTQDSFYPTRNKFLSWKMGKLGWGIKEKGQLKMG